MMEQEVKNELMVIKTVRIGRLPEKLRLPKFKITTEIKKDKVKNKFVIMKKVGVDYRSKSVDRA